LRRRCIVVQWTVANLPQEAAMLKWALIFAVIALVAGVFGFTGIAAGAAGIAKFLFFVFVALCVLALILGATVFKAVKD
jgi:uncharacterized membrane protein YtjA (UPF0391 family)